ncbi:flavodoxin family protein [Clostridia bacterium]|nr:flavodoxin family protein [Clostridia bacterium]
MNIIGFSGSPRKSGSTAVAVGKILEGAREQGANTQMFGAGEREIKPCQGCLYCVTGSGCAVKDDMQAVYAALKTADALVFGAPIYLGQMSGQAKVFMDRLFAQITPRFSPRFKEANAGKKLILVWTQGNPDGEKFREYLDYTKKMFELLEFDVRDVVVVAGTRTETVNEQAGLAERLKRVGAELAR